MARASPRIILNFLQCKKTKLKSCHCILKNIKKSMTPHHKKRIEKNNDRQFPRIKILKDEIEKK